MQRSDLVSLLLVASGLNRFYSNRLAGPGFPILAYHEVTAKTLAAHIKALAPYYRFMSLEDALAYQGPERSRPPIVLTFDDGYKSWLTEVVPVLKKKRIPAMFFPTVAYVDKQVLPWFEVVDRFIRRRRGTQIVVGGEVFAVRALARQPDVRRALHQKLKSLPHPHLQDEMLKLESQLAPEDKQIIRDRYLSWDELRTLPGPHIEIGSHTLTHPILTRIPISQVRDELVQSRVRLETELSLPIRYLAYPNGLAGDLSDEIVREAKAAGYLGALTALSGWNPPGIDAFRLRRSVVAPDGTGWRLRATATGLLGLLDELWSWRNGGNPNP